MANVCQQGHQSVWARFPAAIVCPMAMKMQIQKKLVNRKPKLVRNLTNNKMKLCRHLQIPTTQAPTQTVIPFLTPSHVGFS